MAGGSRNFFSLIIQGAFAMKFFLTTIFGLLLGTSLVFSQPKADSGFTLLFNGKDFSGWKMNKTNESLEGKVDAGKMRFIIKDGNLVIDPKVKGDLTINTAQDFEKDVHIKFEYKPDTKCNNDLFLRGMKFDIKKGDVKNIKFDDWNSFEIILKSDSAEFKNNGELQKTLKAKPGKTPFGIRAENGGIEFKNLQYK
ncbi:MAG: DUF1080 domain-containing protein [Planctomycetes bacterium]|nr:DUF1080 domain-containing protein [Planctomycetota bacterium]